MTFHHSSSTLAGHLFIFTYTFTHSVTNIFLYVDGLETEIIYQLIWKFLDFLGSKIKLYYLWETFSRIRMVKLCSLNSKTIERLWQSIFVSAYKLDWKTMHHFFIMDGALNRLNYRKFQQKIIINKLNGKVFTAYEFNGSDWRKEKTNFT